MNCLVPSRKVLKADRNSKSTSDLHEMLMSELQNRLEITSVKSCENLTSSNEVKVKKTHSFRFDKPLLRIRKSESFLAIPTRGNGSIYGTKLTSNQMDATFKNVPKFLVECCRMVERKLDDRAEVQGVYRVPGEHSRIQKLGKKMVKDDFEYLSSVECINVLAGSIKLFLRESQTPLITSEEIQRFKGLGREEWCSSTTDTKCSNLRKFFEGLDPVRKDTLEFILMHLKRLCDTYPDKLNSKNFAISIGPAVIHINRSTCLSVTDILIEHEILNEYLEFMIDNCFIICREDSDKDDSYSEELTFVTSL